MDRIKAFNTLTETEMSKLFLNSFSFITRLSLCVSYAIKTKLPDDAPVQELATFVLFCLGIWQSLSSEVILENSKLPEGVTIAYTSRCKNGVVSEGENGRKCSNISIGDEVRIGELFFFVVCNQSVIKPVKAPFRSTLRDVKFQMTK